MTKESGLRLAGDLARLHPAVAQALRDNTYDDGFLLHLFMGQLAFWLVDSVRDGEASAEPGRLVHKVVHRLDTAYATGDEDVCNAIMVSFLENIMDDDPAEAVVRSALTPRLAEAFAELERWFETASAWVPPPPEPTGPLDISTFKPYDAPTRSPDGSAS